MEEDKDVFFLMEENIEGIAKQIEVKEVLSWMKKRRICLEPEEIEVKNVFPRYYTEMVAAPGDTDKEGQAARLKEVQCSAVQCSAVQCSRGLPKKLCWYLHALPVAFL